MKAPSRLSLILAFAAVYIVWGSTYLAIKIALESFPTFVLAGVRFILAGLLLLAISYPSYRQPITWRQWRSAFVIGGLLFLIANAGVVWAETRISSGLAALIVSSVPFWMVVVDWVRPQGKRPSWPVVAGLVMGFLGIILLIGPDQLLTGGDAIDTVAILVLVSGSLAWAIGSIYSREADLPSSPMVGTAMEMLAGGILLSIASVVSGDLAKFDLGAVQLDATLALIYLFTMGSLVGFTSYVYLLRNTTAARAGTYAYVNPLVALVLGWAFADESINLRTLLAAVVILGSVFMITIYRQRGPSAPAARTADPVVSSDARLPESALVASAGVAAGD